MGSHVGLLPRARWAEPHGRRRADPGLVERLPDPRAAPGPPHRRHGRRLLRAARAGRRGRRRAGRSHRADWWPRPGPCWPPSTPGTARAASAATPPAGRVRRRPAGTGCAAQVLGLLTTARKLAGEPIGYADEVEACYGVRPSRVDEEVLAAAHRRLDEVLPGDGSAGRAAGGLAGVARRPRRPAAAAIDSLAEDLRDRTRALFGLPDGEHVEFELVSNEPWSGFNYYLGELQSRVAINTDLPGAVDRPRPPGGPRVLSRATTPSTPARRSAWSAAASGGRSRSSWWAPRSACWPRAWPTSGLEVVMGRRPEADGRRPPAPARDPLRRRGGGGGGRGGRGPRGGAPERRLPPPRGRRRPRHGDRRGGAVGAAVPGPGGQGGRVPHPPDVAGLSHLLRGGASPLPGLRRRGPGPVRPAARPSS